MWSDSDSYGKDLGELIEYERGSVFGGIMTVAVFIGFGYLLFNDVIVNINQKLYTLNVRDKLLTEAEASELEIDF